MFLPRQFQNLLINRYINTGEFDLIGCIRNELNIFVLWHRKLTATPVSYRCRWFIAIVSFSPNNAPINFLRDLRMPFYLTAPAFCIHSWSFRTLLKPNNLQILCFIGSNSFTFTLKSMTCVVAKLRFHTKSPRFVDCNFCSRAQLPIYFVANWLHWLLVLLLLIFVSSWHASTMAMQSKLKFDYIRFDEPNNCFCLVSFYTRLRYSNFDGMKYVCRCISQAAKCALCTK